MGKGKSKTTGKGRLDKFYFLAKEQGYRSRAAFKLVQLNRKYQFLERSRALLDLCAAPGGWLQVAVKYMPVSSVIIGVDLVPIRPIRGCTTLTQDITTPKCRSEIKKILNGALLDVVLHDGSPNVGGAWAKEAMSQAALSLDSLKLAVEFLKPGGMFVSKVFRSQDYSSLLYAFKQLFSKVEATKPVASRSASAEIYVVCSGFKAPKKIDPRLLDVKHIFKEIVEPAKIVDVMGETKQKRHRQGYEDGVSVLRKTSTAAAFVSAEKPVEFLGTFHAITFDTPGCQQIRADAATDPEIVELCSDLQVLGKREFKQLLKWRMKIRKTLPELSGQKKDAEEAAEEEGGRREQKVAEGEEDEDAKEEAAEEAMMAEMLELKEIVEAKKRREKKSEKKRREKTRHRTATGMSIDAVGDGYGDEELFSLGAIKKRSHLGVVDDAAAPDNEHEAGDSDDDSELGKMEEVGSDEEEGEEDEDFDSDGEKRRYTAELEDYFDAAYEKYCEATKSAKRKARARLGTTDNDDEEEEEKVEEGMEEERRRVEGMTAGGGAVGRGLEEDEVAEGKNPLLVSLEDEVDAETKKKKMMTEWFSQELFQGEENENVGREDGGLGMTVESSDDEGFGFSEGEEDGEEGEDVGEEEGGFEQEEEDDEEALVEEGIVGEDGSRGGHDAADRKVPDLKRLKGQGTAAKIAAENDDGFEIVKAESSDSSMSSESDNDSSDDDEEDLDAYDSDAKAETIAYAKRMLRKRSRDDIIDDGYNRYTFDDVDLPKWFEADESKHMRAIQPITKEEVLAIKAQWRAINARPVKKVAEAKARKKRIAMKKMEAVNQKANAIAEQPDLNNRTKGRLTERLYKNAARSGKQERKKEVVVAKKGLKGNRGRGAKGKVMVDRRMKKDTRALKAKQKKSKGKGKNSGSGGKRGKR